MGPLRGGDPPRLPGPAALVLAAAAGASLWLAHPPAGLWPLSLLTVPLLLAALAVAGRGQRPDGRAAALLGALAGVVAYGPMLQWLTRPAGVLGWGLLTLVLAAWMALAAAVIAPSIGRSRLALVAPVAWVAMDAWRAVVPLGGFGWGEIAYAHTDGSWLLPLARLLGGRLITLVVALAGTLAFMAARRAVVGIRDGGGRSAAAGGAAAPAAAAAVVLLAPLLIAPAPPAPTGERLEVLTVQGNDTVVPRTRGSAEDRAIAARMLAETRAAVAADGRPELTVWPENSLDRDPFEEVGADLQPMVTAAADLVGGNLAAGVISRGPGPGHFENQVVMLGPDGRPRDLYVKRRLVPFGEYVPLRPLLGGLPPLRRVPADGVPGEEPRSLAVGGDVRVAPAICFETLFPGLVRSNVLAADTPAQVVLATTNDASFGRSAEPAQHLAQSELRAVETGRWVVHAALSGSSAFVDPRGRAHQATDLYTATSIRRRVPLVADQTLFLRLGDLVGSGGRLAGLGLVAWVLAQAWSARRRRRGSPPRPSVRSEHDTAP